MRTLVIDCATEACSVALFEGDALLAGQSHMLGRGHAEALVPMIAAMPGKGRADRIAVALGPGSFTGVRVGLAAARALALAWGADLVGYPTLSLVAAIAQSRGIEHVTVCMTGGHGEWFVQDFAPGVLPETEIASLTPEAACRQGHCANVAGTRAEDLLDLQPDAVFRAHTVLPDAREFGLLPEVALIGNPSPLYGRAPDAKLPSVRA